MISEIIDSGIARQAIAMNMMELPHCATEVVTPKSCCMYGRAMFVPSCSKK